MEKYMKKNQLKLAVAGAVLAAASIANAGIVIPAGDWTLDVGGNVNAYSIWSNSSGAATIVGGINSGTAGAAPGSKTTQTFNNGLLPNFLSVSGSTRQNDLDVGFTISLQPGTANTGALNQVDAKTVGANGGLNNRQAFLTFGDKSWGSIKMGKDLGIFASDAILNDMTLLGVGAGSGPGNTTLGRIGTGYIYADWKPQFAYTTPNFSGFQATVGVTQAFTSSSNATAAAAGASLAVAALTAMTDASPNANLAYEGKASYAFNANGVDGKVWVSGIAQHVGSFGSTVVTNTDPLAYAGDIGAKVSAAGFDLVGYYYSGQGIGTTGQMLNGYGRGSTSISARDSDGGYVQAMYTLPTKTKVGISYGISNLDLAAGELSQSTISGSVTKANSWTLVKSNELYTAGIYHPLTKHLNLVAEYNHVKAENQGGEHNTTNTGSLGAILFF
jgi:predicted porin